MCVSFFSHSRKTHTVNAARPCPFYQQGRCLFSDSCNFMHNVSVRVQLATPVMESVLSPPRSPRMTDLLSVLKDVIGEEEEEVEADGADE